MKQSLSKELDRLILLNPGPATTSIRVKEAMLVSDICPREKSFGKLMNEVREKACLAVNGKDEYEAVLLGGSGSGAIESCLSSCVDSNDGILIIENGAYGQRMKNICDALEIRYEVLKFSWGETIDLQKLEDYLKDYSSKFRVMAFVHHETTTGILNSLTSLNVMAKKYGLISLVDAMSSYGGIEIDLKKDQVDYLISSSNKCIQGMAGIGIVIVRSDELKKIKEFKVKSFYFNLYKNYFSQKEKGQFLFTPPVQTLYALSEAFDEFFDEGGISKRSNRYAELYQKMYDGMLELGFKPLLEEQFNSKILTTFFEPVDSKYCFEDMHNFLFSHGITIYPGKIDSKKTFRISNIGDLSTDDIAFFLKIVSDYLFENQIEI